MTRPRGTIRQRGSRFTVILDRGADPVTGKRRRESHSGYRTRKEAERARTKLLRELDEGRYVDRSTVTLAKYLREEWLPARKPKSAQAGRGHRGQVGIGTWATYRNLCEAYVIAHLGHIRLQALTADDLDRLYDRLEENGGRRGEGLAPKTISNIHRLLHKALGDAVKRGKVGRNAADLVDAPSPVKSEPTVWTVDQLRRFLAHVRTDELYAAWLLFATTGMRRGEVAGLARGDLDLDHGRLRIDWTLGCIEGKPTWKPRPKSKAGERVMSLDPATVDALREHLAAQASRRLQIGPGWERRQCDWQGLYREDLVFTWPDGRLINPDRFTDWFEARRRE
ncbi:MAG: Arm DNA-binding domain-containing protein, partial [Egibacteraceae bacterium]